MEIHIISTKMGEKRGGGGILLSLGLRVGLVNLFFFLFAFRFAKWSIELTNFLWDSIM